MTILGREPAVVIGAIVSAILAAISALTEGGLVNEAFQGRVEDVGNAVLELGVILAPLITGLLIRPVVTPTGGPQ